MARDPRRPGDAPGEARAARELDALWDALLDDSTTPLPPPQQPGDVRAPLLRALATPPASPDLAAVQARVWRRLRSSSSLSPGKDGPVSVPLTLSPNGHGPLAPTAPWRPSPPAPTPARGRPVWSSVAAAALLALVLMAGLVLPRLLPTATPPDPTRTLPAVATPAATPDVAPAPVLHTWAMYRGGPAHLGVSADPGPGGSPVQLWRFPTGVRVNSEPAVVNGIMYAGSENGHIYALDALTGAVKWDVDTGNSVDSSPAVAAGVVYIADGEGNLLALDAATGGERWRFAGSRPEASPAVLDGVVYSGGSDANLYALDAASGEVIWQSPLGDAASRAPGVGGGLVAVGAADGALHVFDQATGAERWRFATTDGGTVSTPVMTEDTVYVAAFDGSAPALYALDAATGATRWQFATANADSVWVPALVGDTLYAGSDDGNLYALNAADGTERWHFATGDSVDSSGTVAGDMFLFASLDRNLYALDRATGRELWRFPLDDGSNKGPSIVDGVAYIGTNAGSIYAIGGTEAAGAAAPAPALTVPTSTPDADAAPAVQADWESTGNPAQPLDHPADIELAPDGHLWVTDGGNSQFQILDTDGRWVGSWGAPGAGEGQFNFAATADDFYGGIEFTPDGGFYVLDTGNSRVQQFGADRTFIRAFGSKGDGEGQFPIRPIGLALSPEGHVLVLVAEHAVMEFSADGAYLRSIPLSEGGNNDLAVDIAGAIHVSSEKQPWVVRTYAADGSVTRRAGDGDFPEQPLAIAFDAQNRMFVTSGASILLFDADGTFLARWGGRGDELGEIMDSGGIVVDGAVVYDADYGSGRIQQFTLLPPLAP